MGVLKKLFPTVLTPIGGDAIMGSLNFLFRRILMKSFVAILLCVLLLFSTVSCVKHDGTGDWKNPTADNAQNDNAQNGASGEAVPDEPVPETVKIGPFADYGMILDALLEVSRAGGVERFEAKYPELDERESKIYHELGALRDGWNVGYYIGDLNSDGVDELVLMQESRLAPVVLFTLKNSLPVLLTWFWTDGNHTGAIDKDGVIYRSGYGKGESCYKEILEISNGELVGLIFGISSDDPDEEQEYYKIYKGNKSVISKSEYEALCEKYKSIFDDMQGTTVSSELDYSYLINGGKYFKEFCRRAGDSTTYSYEVYDKNGNVVLSGAGDDHLDFCVFEISSDFICIVKNLSAQNETTVFYDVSKNLISESFGKIWEREGERIVFFEGEGENKRLIVRDIFDTEVFYREYDHPICEAEKLYWVNFSPDGKTLELQDSREGDARHATWVICFETMPILRVTTPCFVRKEASIGDNHVMLTTGKAVLRHDTGDTVRLLGDGTITGGEYTSADGTVRNDWYKIEYRGEVCYVTADSFEVDIYRV